MLIIGWLDIIFDGVPSVFGWHWIVLQGNYVLILRLLRLGTPSRVSFGALVDEILSFMV